jgi:hypothetical protein
MVHWEIDDRYAASLSLPDHFSRIIIITHRNEFRVP